MHYGSPVAVKVLKEAGLELDWRDRLLLLSLDRSTQDLGVVASNGLN